MVSSPFDTVLGQTTGVELLLRAVACQRIAPAYLFAGPEGVGRRLAAIALAELLLIPRALSAQSPAQFSPTAEFVPTAGHRRRIHQRNHPDLFWVEPTYLHQGKLVTPTEAMALGIKRKSPPQIRLAQIRELGRFLSRPPLEAQRSLVIIDRAETMAEAAANGLLKTLEEPGRATLILLAPYGHALLPTLVSRCQRIPFSRLDTPTMTTVLEQTGYGAILAHPEILALAQGSPGQAIASWQQYQSIPEDLWQTLTLPPETLQQALQQARIITKTLELETQVWLIGYLQHRYWQQDQIQVIPWLEQLEKARHQLLSYSQPRLVWEVALMALVAHR